MSGLTCQKQLGAATAKDPSLVASLVCRLSGLRQFPSRHCRTYRALLAPRSRTLRYRSGGALRALALQVLQNPPVHSGAPYLAGCKSPWSQRPRALDFMGSSYAARVWCPWLQIAHSNVCKSTPGRASSILTSIIGALHFGQAGRSIATNGMTDDRRWDWGMMLPSNRRERNTLCHR